MPLDDLNRAVGQCLRRHRESAGWSQEELADRCGLHRTYVGAIERGERNITLKTLQAVASALVISPSGVLAEAEHDARPRRRR